MPAATRRIDVAVRDLTANEDRNLLPRTLACVEASVTLGEIADALRGECEGAGLE